MKVLRVNYLYKNPFTKNLVVFQFPVLQVLKSVIDSFLCWSLAEIVPPVSSLTVLRKGQHYLYDVGGHQSTDSDPHHHFVFPFRSVSFDLPGFFWIHHCSRISVYVHA